MQVVVVQRPGAGDLGQVAGDIASFTTETVYDVSTAPDGFRLTPRQVAPRAKRYDLLAAHRDADPPWDVLLLATEAGRTTGLAATTYQSWNSRQVLNELHVAPRHRRQGVARALLDEVIGIGRGNGAREVWTETQNVNYPAVQAYLRLGFRLTGLDTTLYGGEQEPEAALFLSRSLTPNR